MTQLRRTNQLLGYPDNARLLIINADDFGMAHSINKAIFRSLKEGIVRSTSLMIPCPSTLHAIYLLHENPDIDFGIHLTVICDTATRNWTPISPPEKVPSLIAEKGHFFPLDRMKDLVAQAKLDELEMEFRAQIQVVLDTELKPSHLDWHCLHSGGRPDIFEMTLKLAKEYGLALRVANQPHIETVQNQGLPTDDYDLLDSYDLPIPNKPAKYAQMLQELPAGLTEWAVHPGLESEDLRTVEPHSWQVRQTDYDFVMSPEAKEIIQKEGIILIDYKALQNLWQGKS